MATLANARLAEPLRAPFKESGCTEPEFTATLAAHAEVGHPAGSLWQQVEPVAAAIDRVTEFCLRAARPDR